MQPNEKRPLNTASIAALAFTGAVLLACAVFFCFVSCSNGDYVRPDDTLVIHAAGVETPSATVLPTPTVQYAFITPQPVQQGAAQETQAPVYYNFSITIGGLAAFQSDITQSLLNDPGYSEQDVFAHISRYIHADRNIVVLDNLLSNSANYTDTMAPGVCAAALHQAGFDTVVLSNDHVLDYDTDGLLNTVGILNSEGMTVNGTGAGAGEGITFININGAKIALVSYTETLTGKSAERLTVMPEAVTVYSAEQARSDLQYAREQGAEFVIVFMYWGKEEAESVSAAQRDIAQTLSLYGADAIIGTNPHIAQPLEMLIGYNELTGRPQRTLVAYSMGSLITESRENREHISSFLLHLEVTCSSDDVRFVSVGYTPLYIWNDRANNNNRFYSVYSAGEAPEGMSDTQKTYMEHSLQFIKNRMDNGVAVMVSD